MPRKFKIEERKMNENSTQSSNFWANLRQILVLPKWAKVFLVALSGVAVAGLIAAFGLKAWAADKVDSGEIVLKGIDRGAQARLDSGFAYDSRLYFQRLDFLLRSKVIAYIDIQGISWAEGVDKNAVTNISSHNRWVKFTTTQDLLSQGFNEKNLGKVEYKMDFSPFVKTILKYYALIFALFIICIFGFNTTKRFSLESPKMLDLAQNLGFKLALATLVFIATLFILSTLGFLVHLSINAGYFYLALIASLAALLYKNSHKIPSLALYALAFGVAFALALVFYDSSSDGRTYHQTGVFFLANGWNPIYQHIADLSEFKQFFSDYFWANDETWKINSEFWIEHYLKFAETTQACIYKALGLIESGKALNYLFAFGAFCYTFSVLLKFKKLSVKMAFLLSFLGVFSPVVLMQICTYYIDGFLGCALAFLLLSVLDVEISRKNGENLTLKYAVFILALLATASIKLTGVGYAGFIGVAYLIYRAVFFGVKNAKGVFVSGVISAFLIIICNANPLITNQIQHGHFGYPLLGKVKFDNSQKTKDMKEVSSAQALLKSLFSKTKNQCCNNYETELKIPFIRYIDEHPFDTYYMWIGGFGYYFSGVLVLCLFMVLKYPQYFKRKEFIFAVGLILGSVLINPESWFARYAPQMWLVPFVFLVFSYTFLQTKMLKVLQILFVFFLTLNSYDAFKGAVLNSDGALGRNYTKNIKNKLDNLVYKDKIYLYFEPKTEPLFAVKLFERNYPFEFISSEKLKNLQSQGVNFYPIGDIYRFGDINRFAPNAKALWNVAPKDAK